MENKENFLAGCAGIGGCLYSLILPSLIACLVASWLCDINSGTTYSWYHGIWHGIFFIPNLIRSIFTDAIFKAELYSSTYNIFWWITVVFEVLGILIGGFSKQEV